MAEAEQNNDPGPLHFEGGGIVIDKPKSEEQIAREARDKEDHEFKRDQVKTNRRLSTLTFWLVVVGVGGLGVSLWQSSISQQSADTSDKSILLAQRTERDSRKASEEQTRQSNKALQTAIDNFRQEQRAYLVPGDPTDEGGYGLLSFPISNYGRTMAKNVTVDVHFGRFLMGANAPMETLLDRRVVLVKVDTPILPSNAPSYVLQVFAPNLTKTDNIAISNETQNMIVRGTISYDSGFGDRDLVGICYFFQRIKNRWENCSANRSVQMGLVKNSRKDVEHKRWP